MNWEKAATILAVAATVAAVLLCGYLAVVLW
jgi:hypothetical protein